MTFGERNQNMPAAELQERLQAHKRSTLEWPSPATQRRAFTGVPKVPKAKDSCPLRHSITQFWAGANPQSTWLPPSGERLKNEPTFCARLKPPKVCAVPRLRGDLQHVQLKPLISWIPLNSRSYGRCFVARRNGRRVGWTPVRIRSFRQPTTACIFLWCQIAESRLA
jgi:hypothetical protein